MRLQRDQRLFAAWFGIGEQACKSLDSGTLRIVPRAIRLKGNRDSIARSANFSKLVG